MPTLTSTPWPPKAYAICLSCFMGHVPSTLCPTTHVPYRHQPPYYMQQALEPVAPSAEWGGLCTNPHWMAWVSQFLDSAWFKGAWAPRQDRLLHPSLRLTVFFLAFVSTWNHLVCYLSLLASTLNYKSNEKKAFGWPADINSQYSYQGFMHCRALVYV